MTRTLRLLTSPERVESVCAALLRATPVALVVNPVRVPRRGGPVTLRYRAAEHLSSLEDAELIEVTVSEDQFRDFSRLAEGMADLISSPPCQAEIATYLSR
jgi:hypothetical protein